MALQLSTPSKTFLLGEYLALVGGPTLILCTEPRFKLRVFKKNNKKNERQAGINPHSPAGKFIRQHSDFFKKYYLQFTDPHSHAGGFGASSAQFAMVAMFKKIVDESSLTLSSLLDEYQTTAWNGAGVPPSGADVIAQVSGGVTFFHRKVIKLEMFPWNFSELQFCLIRTGRKMATHKHLKKLPDINYKELERITKAGVSSFRNNESKKFIHAIKSYADALETQGLVATETQKLLKKIYTRKEVLAAKGCGAMGSDVILVLIEPASKSRFLRWAKSQRLDIVITETHAAHGLDLSLDVR
jgi:mevalonate kinase